MNNDIADIISQMDDRTFYQFLQTDFKDLTGREFLSQQIKNQDTQQLKERAINAVQLTEQPDEVKSRVISAYFRPEMKLSSAEVEQPQQGRSVSVTGYSFDDDSYNAIAGEYDDVGYDLLDDSAYAPSGRNQRGAAKPSGVSQAPLDLEGVRKAIEQNPNWQPRNDYEKWAVGFLQGTEWTPNPTATPANVNRTTGVPTPKAPNEKYQFNVLEDRENRTANVKNIPIPKPVGIRTDLQTGLVYDYNRGLVFNPATGVTQKLISGGKTIPTKLEVPNLIQGEQSNFIPVPAQQIQEPHEIGYYSPVNPDASLIPNRQLTPEELSEGWGKLIASGKPISPPEYSDLSPQARQYLVDRQWNKDKEQAYIQQQQAVDNQLTSGENRFFGTANFSPKRDYSIPDEYKRFIGTSPRIAQVNQAYSPEVMSRVGQGGFLNNTGSILLPQTWIDKETGNTVFSRGRGTATTIVYKNDGKGGVIPMLSKGDGMGNDFIELNDAVTRNIISPVDGKRIIGSNDGQQILSPIENKTIGTRNLITLGQLKAAKDIAAQTRFISASGMDSFNRENVKLYEATDNSGNNYRAIYMNPQTKEVLNVTRNGGFYLVRPGVSEGSSGLPTYGDTTNLAQEMTDINRGMREGGRDNLVDIIRENPDNPGLEAFTRPVPAINPITGETINKYVNTGNSGRWVDENNPQDLFNYFNANVEGSGQSMEALDLARGGRRTAGIRKAPADMFAIPELRFTDGSNRTAFRPGINPGEGEYINVTPDAGRLYLGINRKPYGNTGYIRPNATPAYPSLQETDYLGGRLGFNAEGNIVDTPEVIQSDNVSVQPNLNVKVHKNYHDLPFLYKTLVNPGNAVNNLPYAIDYDQKTEGLDYIPYEPNTNTESRVAKIPLPEVPEGINNFTPASEFYTNTSQLVRDTRTGKVIYDPNRTVYVRTGSTGFDDGDFAVVPYKEDRYQKAGSYQVNRPIYGEKQNLSLNQGSRRIADVDNSTLLADVPESLQLKLPFLGKGNPNPPIVYSPANLQVSRQQTIEGYEPGEVDVFQPYSVYPGDFTNTQFYRFRTNPETPLRAYNVNEYGVPIPNSYGFPREILNSKGEPIQLPRSAQIANKAEFISQPRLMVQDFKGVTPDYQPVLDGMSYEEADRKGLLNPIFNARTVGLNNSYQIPLPKGVGLARVLDEADPRTQAAITAQAEAEARIAADTTIVKPAFDRKYTITPGRIAGIESPQYGQYIDLTSKASDTNAGWKENISGVVPKGVIEGAYLPVTVTPRPVNTEGKKGWLINNQIYTTESGREVRGDKALNYVNVPLNLDSVATSYLPKSKREELELKGFSSDEIDDWVKANPNLARDNALANAKILIDGQYYDVTPQATAPEFNPAAGGNYLQAVNRSEHKAARIDLPFKAGKNISEPTPEWIAEQAAKGNLAFNPDDYISPDDKAILDQKEVYNVGYEEPTDILGAINRVQQKKNRIDAVISNREQRAVPRIQQLSADELRQKSQELDVAIDYAMQTNQKGLGLKLAGQKAQLDLLSISTQQLAMDNLNEQVGSVVDGNYTTLSPGMRVFNQDMLANPTDLSTPISEDFVGPVQLIRDVQSPTRKTFKGWQDYSNYLGDEIARASAAHNAIIGIEDAPEISVKRTGTYNAIEDFNERVADELGLKVLDSRNPSYIVGYDKYDRPLYQSETYGSLPNNLLPYEQAKALNETKLLPAYRTQQKVELSTVPTSNVMNLGRVTPFPEEVITTQQLIPAGNQVVNIANSDGVAIVPSSSRQSINPEVIDTPRARRRNQTQGVVNDVFSMGNNTPNTPIEPDVRMTGMKIPKWAIPATLGAVWLGLAANARRQQDEERRQQQSIGIR